MGELRTLKEIADELARQRRMARGADIKRRRKALDWSPAELARRASVPSSTVSRAENDGRGSEAMLLRLEQALTHEEEERMQQTMRA